MVLVRFRSDVIGKHFSEMGIAKQRNSGPRMTSDRMSDVSGYDTSPLLGSLILKINFKEWISYNQNRVRSEGYNFYIYVFAYNCAQL